MTCEIYGCADGETYEFNSSSIHTARKEHTCGECGRTIQVGEKYEVCRGLYEGEWSTDKTCIDCLSLRETYFCSWMFGNIWEDFEEWLRDWWWEDGSELWKLENLTPKARERVLEIISEWDSEEEEDV